MQRTIVNDTFFNDKSFNEIYYEFTSTINIDLFAIDVTILDLQKIAIINSIVMTQMLCKKLYDQRH